MLTKADLITSLAELNSLPKREAEQVIDTITGVIAADLAIGGGVILKGFGKIYAADRKAGIGCNPRTGEKVAIPAKRTARFKPGKALAEQMNAG